MEGLIEEFWGIVNFGTKLLQISRSTPYLTSALIGHKQVSLHFFDLQGLFMPSLDITTMSFF